MDNSSIEWTHHTDNIWIGCDEVHEGCDNCYARILNHRWGRSNWGKESPRRAVAKVWGDFIRQNKIAGQKGEVHRVFVGSMMDIAEKSMPVEDSKGNLLPYQTSFLRDKYFNEIIPSTPNLLHLLLSKRPSNYMKVAPLSWLHTGCPENIIFGASISDQPTADTLIPQLLKVPGNRFLSIEPMLGPIDIRKYLWRASSGDYCTECGCGGKTLQNPCDNHCSFHPIDWVICGGESGHNRRPFDLAWARDLRDQCKEAKVPFFFKQIDKVNKAIPEDLMIREFPNIEFNNH